MHPRKREFIELFNASGWSQAELARQLEMTRGGVNGIINGETVPSETALKLLKLCLSASGGRMAYPQPAAESSVLHDHLAQSIRALPNEQRRAAELFVEHLANSKAISAAKAGAASAVALARQSGPESSPLPATDGPSVRRSKPRRGSASRSTGQRAPQAHAPK